MNLYERTALTSEDRSALRRTVTSCVVAHDRLIGRIRAVVAIGRSNLDWTDVAEARACASFRDFAESLPAGRRSTATYGDCAKAHEAFHTALGASLAEALAHAPQASASVEIGGAVVVAAEVLRTSLYEWMNEA